MFERFTATQKLHVYLGLKALIESDYSHGFANMDKGHPVYRASAEQERLAQELKHADSPEKSSLFQMLSELSHLLKEEGIEDKGFEFWYDFTEWQDFCRFAVAVKDSKKS